jgi:immune inhibitor A
MTGPTSRAEPRPITALPFSFVTYFLDRFGDEAVQALVAHPENGLESVDAVLKEMSFTDPLTGLPITADDVFADWAVANYLREARSGDGRYTYNNYPYGPKTSDTEVISRCPQDWQDRTVQAVRRRLHPHRLQRQLHHQL